MKIIFLGSGDFGSETLKWLVRSEHEILEVATQPARPAGRGRKAQPTAIAALSAGFGLPCRETSDVNDTLSVEHIRLLRPELLLVIAFGQWVGPELLNLPGCRVINLHASLLPMYRGAAPINWAIINGDQQTGLTVIELNDVWDGGNILGQCTTDIQPGETAGQLHDRLALMGPNLVEDVLEGIAQGSTTSIVQDEQTACRAPKLCKSDGAIHWDWPAERIRNLIHGIWPWPGAFCFLEQSGKKRPERISLAHAEVISDSCPEPSAGTTVLPGTVADDLSIYCGSGRLKLLQVRPENGKLMDFMALVNGRHLKPGDLFLNG